MIHPNENISENFNSFTVIATDPESMKTVYHSEWEVDGDVVVAAHTALAAIIRAAGRGDLLMHIDFHNA